MRKKIGGIGVFFWLVWLCQAQEWKPEGRFLADSLQVGRPIQYTFSFLHPPEMQVIFPDSAYRFSSFTLLNKRYFPTRTNRRGSLDSVVYTFTTFDIAPVQRLQLPVFIIQAQDCTAVYTETDSIIVKQLIDRSPRFLPPKTNIRFVPVPQTLNYQLILLIGGVSLGVLLIIYSLFGKQLRRQYQVYRLWRDYRIFIGNYERLRRKVRQQKESIAVENTITLWKKYMEDLHQKPYSSYTTKEIMEVISDAKLADSLQTADRAIYGNNIPDEIYGALRTLQSIAEYFYKRKRVETSRRK